MNLEIIYKHVDALIPYVNNSRTHSESQIAQIASSIKEFGFTNPILLDEEEGVIAGHGRIMAAKLLSLDNVPTITLEGLSEAQRKAYVIADNKLALNSGWDVELLQVELDNIADMDLNLQVIGFGEVELEAILKEEMDMSILDELDSEEVDSLTDNVKKAIQIEFEAEHIEEARELIKFWRSKDAYIGYMIIQYLRSEMQKL